MGIVHSLAHRAVHWHRVAPTKLAADAFCWLLLCYGGVFAWIQSPEDYLLAEAGAISLRVGSTAGYRFSSSLADTFLFGGPLPPEPVNPDPSDPHANEKVKALGDKYFPEYNRRKGVYTICWGFNELIFGATLASFYVLVLARVRQLRRELPRAS